VKPSGVRALLSVAFDEQTPMLRPAADIRKAAFPNRVPYRTRNRFNGLSSLCLGTMATSPDAPPFRMASRYQAENDDAAFLHGDRRSRHRLTFEHGDFFFKLALTSAIRCIYI